MTSATWRPSKKKYGVAICNFTGVGVDGALSLQVGETVHIFEEFDSGPNGWFRGHSLKSKEKWGIFPAILIHIKPCEVVNEGLYETITPVEDPIVKEVTYVLREWHVIWKRLYVRRHPLYGDILTTMTELTNLCSQLVGHKLSQDEIKEVKKNIVTHIDWGNGQLGMDLVPRINGEQVEADRCSITRLYRIHAQSAQEVQEEKPGNKRRKTIRSRQEGDLGHQAGVTTHHLLVSFKNFGCAVGDPSETLLSLFHLKDNNCICLTEKFLVRHDAKGVPVDLSRLSNYYGLFTDLTQEDLEKDLYLVAHIYRIGVMKNDGKGGKGKGTIYKRPWGVGVGTTNLSKLPSNFREWEFSMKVQCFTSSRSYTDNNFHETQFPATHENMIRRLNQGSTSGVASISKQTGPGLFIAAKILHGDLANVRQEDPMLFSKGVAIVQRLGFSEIITPGEVRNDLYITLKSAEFEKGSKKSPQNVQVHVTVYDANGQQIEKCISHGCGEDPLDTYTSSVFYHWNKPEWNETVKLSVPIQRFAGSHVCFTMFHNSTKVPDKKSIGFSFMRLVDEARIVIKDGSHDLIVYKMEGRKPDMKKYLSLPFQIAHMPTPGHKTPGSKIKISERESLTITTLLCSGKFTQSEDLLGILNWRGEQYKDKISENLAKLGRMQGEDIVKFLNDILDKLFDMFESESRTMVPYAQNVFLSLVHIFTLLHHARFETFKPVIDAYISDLFSATLVHRSLLLCFTDGISKVCTSQGQGQGHANFMLIEVFNAMDYIMRFVVKSRQLQMRNVYSRDSDGGREFDENLKKLFNSMGILLSINSSNKLQSDRLKGYQMALLNSLHLVYKPLMEVLADKDLADCIHLALDKMPKATEIPEDLTKSKLELLRKTVDTKLFAVEDSRKIVLKMCLDQIKHCLMQKVQMRLTIDLLGDILNAIFDIKKTTDIEDDIHTVVIKMFEAVIETVLCGGEGQNCQAEHKKRRRLGTRRQLNWKKRKTLVQPKDEQASPRSATVKRTKSQAVPRKGLSLPPVQSVFHTTDSLQQDDSRSSVSSENLEDHVDGALIVCLTEMLRLMDEDHYNNLLAGYSKNHLKMFLNKILMVFKEVVKPGVFPQDWTVMRMVANNVVFTAVVYFSQALKDDYSSEEKFDATLWSNYFHLAVAFITQPSLQLDRYSEAKAEKIKERYQDMRVLMGVQVETLWHSLGNQKQHFIPMLVGPFLELTLVPEREVRKATLPIIFDMIESDQRINRNFLRVETALFDRLDYFITEGKGDTAYADLFKRILLERVNSEPSLEENGPKFIISVTELLERLLDYRQIIDGEEHRDKRMHCTFNILNFYKENINREEMYIRYVNKLYDLHIMANNYVEAGLTLQLYAKLLHWSEDVLPEELRYQAQPEWKRKEMLYHEIINCFDKGKVWEYGIPMCKDLVEFYERRFEYKKLGDILNQEAVFYNKILEGVASEENSLERYPRQDPAYYRVVYYGQSFPAFVRNKAFVYRGDECLRLSTIMNHLSTEFPSAQIIPNNNPQNEAIKDGDQQYIQIGSVKPVPEERVEFRGRNVPMEIRNFYNVNEVDTFQFDRPYHRGEKDRDNESKTLCIERTKMKTSYKFPGILRWYEVVDTSVEMLIPVRVAIEQTKDYNTELQTLVERCLVQPKLYFNNLEMRLQGVINAAVNGGTSKFIEAFFTREFERDHPDEVVYRDQLQDLLRKQIDISKRGLTNHGRLAPDNLQPLHKSLETEFKKMKRTILQHVSPPVSTGSLSSIGSAELGRPGTPGSSSIGSSGSGRSSTQSQDGDIPDGSSRLTFLEDVLGAVDRFSSPKRASKELTNISSYALEKSGRSLQSLSGLGVGDVPPPIPSRPQSMFVSKQAMAQSPHPMTKPVSDPSLQSHMQHGADMLSKSTSNINAPPAQSNVKRTSTTYSKTPTQRYVRRPSAPAVPTFRELKQISSAITEESSGSPPPVPEKMKSITSLNSPLSPSLDNLIVDETMTNPPPLPPRRTSAVLDIPPYTPVRTRTHIASESDAEGMNKPLKPGSRTRHTTVGPHPQLTSTSAQNGLGVTKHGDAPPPIPRRPESRSPSGPPPLPSPLSPKSKPSEGEDTNNLNTNL